MDIIEKIKIIGDKITDKFPDAPLLKYINFRDKTIRSLGSANKKADDKEKVDVEKGTTGEEEEVAIMGKEPEEIIEYDKKERKDVNKPELIVTLKESLEDNKDAEASAAFSYCVELLKQNKSIDEAIQLTKENFGESLIPEDGNIETEVLVEGKIGTIKKVMDAYRIIEVDGTVQCLKEGEFNEKDRNS